jgi:Calx-beta domain-containing protein/VCBS repeat protein
LKFSSWLDPLRGRPSHRPIRYVERRGRPHKSAMGKLSIENLEARTVPAFLSPVDYPTDSYPIAAISADFNGDGTPDVAVANYYGGNVSVRLGNGDGTFQDATSPATGNNPFGLAVGDLNGDTHLDLVTANANDVSVLMGNGDGTFQSAASIGVGSNPTSVAVGDFNDDGSLDLAVTSNHFVVDYWGYYGYYGHWEGDASVLMGNGGGSFGSPVTTPLGYGYYQGGAAADFDDDGRDDFATTDGYSSVQVLLANPDGSLQGPTAYATGWGAHSVSIGDMNSDGIDDLVTSNSGSVSVLMGNGAAGDGDGTFQAAQSSAVEYYSSSVATGDFNADGKLDLAVSSNHFVVDYWGYYGYYGHYEPQAQVLLGYDNGHFTDAQNSPLGVTGWAYGIASGDFDGNGFSDLAATNSGTNSLSVLINDELWAPLPPPAVSISDASIAEGNTGSTSASFTLSLAFAHTEDVTVHYATANGTATSGSDYTGGSGDVIIHAGDTTATILVPIAGDRLPEPNETFFVNLTSPDVPMADSQAMGVIVDDEPRIVISDAAVTEGNTGSLNATFTVTASLLYDQDVTVHYSTANGTATAGSDFTGVTDATVTIPAGQPSATFNVAVLGDRLGEGDESFSVNLSGATNAEISDGSAAVTILDNEPRITINDVALMEGNGNGKGKNSGTTQFVFTVSLSAAYDQTVTVNFATADGTARVSDNDYIGTSGTVTFAAGETSKTVTVLVVGDKRREPDEWFALNLTGPSTNAFLLDNQGVGWILDNDTHGRH